MLFRRKKICVVLKNLAVKNCGYNVAKCILDGAKRKNGYLPFSRELVKTNMRCKKYDVTHVLNSDHLCNVIHLLLTHKYTDTIDTHFDNYYVVYLHENYKYHVMCDIILKHNANYRHSAHITKLYNNLLINALKRNKFYCDLTVLTIN